MKKRFALLLALALTLSCLGAACGENGSGVYALMSIPYDLFYEAETTGGQYDSVTSATRVKPLMMQYAGGSFHFMPDGREITGVVFPVYAESEEMLRMYGGTELTDDSSVTITVTDNGKQVTTTYTGKDALFQSYPFSYYKLGETPAVYKVMSWNSSFGPMQGKVIQLPGSVSVVPSEYAQVCLKVDGADEVLTELDVNAAVLAARDGTRVGLKHVQHIWMKTFLGFDLDSYVYDLLRGKVLESVELYTLDAKYIITAGDDLKIN